MDSFLDIVGFMGYDDLDNINPSDIKRRTSDETEKTFADLYPSIESGALLKNKAQPNFSKTF